PRNRSKPRKMPSYPVHEAAGIPERSAKLNRKIGGIIQIPLSVSNKSSPTVQTHEERGRI
ncbi:hypothetical protein PIB30_114860, partial [Stylosanthes scabra]|nr:hypothetical protein [Stylosanthes scabra]